MSRPSLCHFAARDFDEGREAIAKRGIGIASISLYLAGWALKCASVYRCEAEGLSFLTRAF